MFDSNTTWGDLIGQAGKFEVNQGLADMFGAAKKLAETGPAPAAPTAGGAGAEPQYFTPTPGVTGSGQTTMNLTPGEGAYVPTPNVPAQGAGGGLTPGILAAIQIAGKMGAEIGGKETPMGAAGATTAQFANNLAANKARKAEIDAIKSGGMNSNFLSALLAKDLIR